MTTAFKIFIATTQLENHEFIMRLVWLFQYRKYLGCFSSTYSQIPPDGSEVANSFLRYFDNEVNDSPDKLSIFSIIIGCTTSAPDGSSP
jgi:hypothetical protein